LTQKFPSVKTLEGSGSVRMVTFNRTNTMTNHTAAPL